MRTKTHVVRVGEFEFTLTEDSRVTLELRAIDRNTYDQKSNHVATDDEIDEILELAAAIKALRLEKA